MSCKVKIKSLSEDFVMPKKGTEKSACFDVTAVRLERVGKYKVIYYLGFKTEIQEGWKAVIVPRSSQTKTDWAILNSPCTIDSDFRGEWQIRMHYVGTVPFDLTGAVPNFELPTPELPFKAGERIAQISFEKDNEVEWDISEELSDTTRGEGGFGHTGK